MAAGAWQMCGALPAQAWVGGGSWGQLWAPRRGPRWGQPGCSERKKAFLFQQLKPIGILVSLSSYLSKTFERKYVFFIKYLTPLHSAVGWESSQSTCESPRTLLKKNRRGPDWGLLQGKKNVCWFGKSPEWFTFLLYHKISTVVTLSCMWMRTCRVPHFKWRRPQCAR